MLLSISNIAWSAENDEEMYAFLQKQGYNGLEIAPTRIFLERPYEKLQEARDFAKRLYESHGLKVSSMQSIWYGRTENIFGGESARSALMDYTMKAVDFAVSVGCNNLVFGCPKNRNVPDGMSDYMQIAEEFFNTVADYARQLGVVIALEPNPPFYGTNFINTTQQAFDFALKVGNVGFKVNIDLGTMIAYNEPVSLIAENLDLVNHIHISEPKLVPIVQREIHKEILVLPFDKYRSVEMANSGDLEKVQNILRYVKALEAKL